MLRADPTIDVDGLARLLIDEYGATSSIALEFAPVGGDSWCFRARDLWVSVRRDRSGHRPAAYEAARALADDGADFVLAPRRGANGRVVHDVGGRPVVVFPFVDATPVFADHADELLSLVGRLHATTLRTPLEHETFDLFFTDELRDALSAADAGVVAGPYSAATIELVQRERVRIDTAHRRLLDLQRTCRALDPAGFVVTHGEPDGNALRTNTGRLLLADVGTLLRGPPERDLHRLPAPPDVAVAPDVAAFYRLAYALGEVAEYVARFTTEHPGDAADDDKWRCLLEFTGELDAR